MLIASWNVNSIRTRLSQVISWISSAKPDVLCIQETKVIDEEFPYDQFLELGYEVKVYGQKSYNGVAIISKIPLINFKKGSAYLPFFCIRHTKNLVIIHANEFQ